MAKAKTSKTKKSTPAKPAKKTSAAKTARKAASPKPAGKKTSAAKTTRKAASPKPAGKKTSAAKTAHKVAPAKVGGRKRLSPRERFIQEIRKRLLHQKHTLLSEAEAAVHGMPEQTIFPDLGDQASVEMDRSFMLRLRGREQKLLKKIDVALERIESGTFGICEACGEDIEVKRLEVRPVTTMCFACKTEQEEEERLMGQ